MSICYTIEEINDVHWLPDNFEILIHFNMVY